MKYQVYSVRQLFGCLGTVALLLLVLAGMALAQTTAFTYQGKLSDNGTPASGNYDLSFKLYDTAGVGSGVQQGATLSLTNVEVSGGVFTVTLDFGACASCFNGATRFLEIAVKPTSGSTFTTLSPRQAVTATPYAIKSMSAVSADGLSVTCVSCVTSSQIQSVNGSAVSGTIPVASVPAGSTNYIQNTTSQQATSNFNISGDGTAGGTLSGNFINATLSYRLGGQVFLRGNASNNNLSLGLNILLPGSGNTLIGSNTAVNLTTGTNHTFLGANTGNQFFNGNNNTLLGANTIVTNGVSNATAIGANASVTQSNSLVLGNNANVGIGTTAPISQLHLNANAASFAVTLTNLANTAGRRGYRLAFDNDRFTFQRADDAGNFADNQVAIEQATGNVGIGTAAPNDKLEVNGIIRQAQFGSSGTNSLCRNSLNQISLCSSSRRYKDNIADWLSGLNLINRLRPVTFDWKESQLRDLGLVAEEVAEVEPLLVTHNDKGEIEGVKYDRLGVVLVNAIKEQQAQIERQQSEIESLKKLVSSFHSKAKRRN